MKALKTAIAAATLGAAMICSAGAAFAGSVTEIGETSGLALGAPLPEGVYFVDTASYISRAPKTGQTEITAEVNIPVIAWSSPWKVLGGRFEAYAALPEAALAVGSTYSAHGLYNPAALFGVAWDLGNGFGFSNFIGGYAPVKNAVTSALSCDCWTFNERAALSYTANGLNLTAHAIYGTSGDDLSTKVAKQPDYINLDLTATKAFGKWDLGLVSYMSSDLSKPNSAYKEQSQIALGPIVGYNFSQLTVQTYLTHDVATTGYGEADTRAYLRFIVPLL